MCVGEKEGEHRTHVNVCVFFVYMCVYPCVREIEKIWVIMCMCAFVSVCMCVCVRESMRKLVLV